MPTIIKKGEVLKKKVLLVVLVCALFWMECMEAGAYFEYPVLEPGPVEISIEIFENFVIQAVDTIYHDFWREGIVKDLNHCRS